MKKNDIRHNWKIALKREWVEDALDATISAHDGISLHYRKDIVPNSKGVVVIAHGLGSYVEKYQYAYLAESLNKHGYSTYSYDARGHGQSSGLKSHLDDAQDMFEDAKVIVDLAKSENSTQKVFMLGISMGGLATAGLSIKYPGTVDGVILTVPAMGASSLADTVPDAPPADPYEMVWLGGEKMQDLVRSGEVKEDVPRVTAGLLYQLMHVGRKFVAENYEKLTDPMLMVQGTADKFVDPIKNIEFFMQCTTDDKELKVYGDVPHGLFGCWLQDHLIDDIVTWLNLHVK